MIIGISGRMGSGKNTVGDIIEKICLTNEGPLFEQKAFAGKLKQIGSILSGVPVEYFEDQDFKKLPMGIEWEMTYREFLQKLGTEAMRDGLHKEVWVNALFADYKYYEKYNHAYTKDGVDYGNRTLHYPDWVITDMRFPNEIAAVELREGITIRVNRDNGTREIDTNPHPSETALDDAKFDYVIENDGTLDELVEKVRAILIREKIIS